VLAGHLIQNMNNLKLENNIETSFISTINGQSWHKSYHGIYGYVVSNSPLTFEKPQFYNYSAQIGNDYGINTNVYAQEIESTGLKKTILL